MSKIVIVDDDATSVRFLTRLVQGLGHEVIAFSVGEEAILQGASLSPDLLITDWLLKERLDGGAIVRSFRKCAPGLPVIIVSGLPRHDLIPALQQLENATLVEKPIDFSVLTRIIAEVTGHHAHRGAPSIPN